jgi:outer membrane receptor for ferrienterochelin and colicins
LKQSFTYGFWIICLVIGIFTNSPLQAQQLVTISVTDLEKNPIEDALVICKPIRDSKKELSMLTNAKGIASFEIDGPTQIILTRVGFVFKKDTLFHSCRRHYALSSNKTILSETVVTGQFEATTTDKSVQRIRVIDQKKIQAQGAVNLKDLLSNELNIRISQDGALGSQISMMGIGGQNLKILIDGVPVIGRMDGNIDLSQINLSRIERVEIIEGPMSVIYGTDALGGVINLISKRPSSQQFKVGVNSYLESVGTYNLDMNAGAFFRNFQVSGSAGRNYFDGYSDNEGKFDRWKQWKPKEQYFWDAQLMYKLKKQSHRLASQFFTEIIVNRNNAIVTPTSATGVDFYFVTTRWNHSLYSDFLLPHNATLNLINSFSTYKRSKTTYIKNLVNGSEELSAAIDDHDTSFFKLFLSRGTLSTRNGGRFNSQLGYDFNYELGGGERLKNDYQAIGDYAGFYIAEIKPISRLKINPGVRFIYNTRYGAPVIPSLNAKFDITSELTFRGSYSRGFRAPSLKELSLFFVDVSHNIQGNENLKAENSHNYSMGLTWLKPKQKVNIKAEITSYYNSLHNLISLALVEPNSQLYTYINIDEYKTKGVYSNLELFWKRITLSGGYSLTGRFNQLSLTKDVTPFNYANEYRLNTVYRFLKWNTDLNLFFKYNGALPGFALDANEELYQTQVAAYSNVDFSLTQKLIKHGIIVVVGVKNILDVTNIQFNSVGSTHSGGGSSMPVGMGRFYFITLKLSFEKN